MRLAQTRVIKTNRLRATVHAALAVDFPLDTASEAHMHNQEKAEPIPADDDRKDSMSNDIEHTPTEKSGDETQRNEQSSTEEGVEDRPRNPPRKEEDPSL